MRFISICILLLGGIAARADGSCESRLTLGEQLRRHLVTAGLMAEESVDQAHVEVVRVDAGTPSGWRALLARPDRVGYVVVPPEGAPRVFESHGDAWREIVPQEFGSIHVYRDRECLLMSVGGRYEWVSARPISRDVRLKAFYATYRAELEALITGARKFTPEDFVRSRVLRGRLLERDLDVLVVPANVDRAGDSILAFDPVTRERVTHLDPREVHRIVSLDDGRHLLTRPAGADARFIWIAPGGARRLGELTSSPSARAIYARYELPFDGLASTLSNAARRRFVDAEAFELRAPHRDDGHDQETFVVVTGPSDHGARPSTVLAILDTGASAFRPVESFAGRILSGRPDERFALDRATRDAALPLRLSPLKGEAERLSRALARVVVP